MLEHDAKKPCWVISHKGSTPLDGPLCEKEHHEHEVGAMLKMQTYTKMVGGLLDQTAVSV
jgi:hypothetical protein